MGSDRSVVFRGGPLSNFAPSPLTLPRPDGAVRQYATVEHFFQASKVLDTELHDRVADTPTAREAKHAGRTVPLRDDWEEIKVSVMLTALHAKFSAEPFKSKLLRTGTRPIIEESRYDLEWGARRSPTGWEGENRLGGLLMQVRSELADTSADEADGQLTLLPR
jgi:ribA/ribD-fused uncharacterized protein